jgi:hypothetical protein
MEENSRVLPPETTDVLGQQWDRNDDPAAFMRLRNWVGDAAFGQVTNDDSQPAMVWVRADPEPSDQIPLYQTFEMMRLFKEGTIAIVRVYQWEGGVTGSRGLGSVGPYEVGHGPRYEVSEEEAPRLQSFIDAHRGMKMPPGIQLAITQLESSYLLGERGLSIMSSVTGLESILVRSNTEVSYQLSRNIAALLAPNRADFDKILRQAKKLYSVRSKFVHSAERRRITDEEVLLSRHFLREAIKRSWTEDWDKDRFLEDLNAKGF